MFHTDAQFLTCSCVPELLPLLMQGVQDILKSSVSPNLRIGNKQKEDWEDECLKEGRGREIFQHLVQQEDSVTHRVGNSLC